MVALVAETPADLSTRATADRRVPQGSSAPISCHRADAWCYRNGLDSPPDHGAGVRCDCATRKPSISLCYGLAHAGLDDVSLDLLAVSAATRLRVAGVDSVQAGEVVAERDEPHPYLYYRCTVHSMRATGWRLAAAVAVLAVGAVVAGTGTPVAAEGQAAFGREIIDAAAVFQTSTCPFGDWTPMVDTECEDWFVLLYRATPDARQHNRSPLRVEYRHGRVVVHPDLTVDVLEEQHGDTADLVGSFDEIHLLGASVRATVPMDDGSRRVIDLVWDGRSSPRRTAGNDGPFNQSSGTPRHYVDRCITFNAHAHQTYRANTAITGVVDGIDVDEFPYVAPFDPFISRGRFTVVIVTHGGCD